jgi:SAM-dependent methyltransferase
MRDPVEAYDFLAPEFARVSEVRRRYLDRVEKVISAEIGAGKRSLLDVGAGDGARSARIAAACGIERLVQLEPSAGMRERGVGVAEIWPIRAEDLGGVQAEFDVIVCLWNVLGHISPAASRQEVIRQFARLLAPDGSIFIDVNHRYNARHYGFLKTAGRLIYDCVRPDERNGDVTAQWNIGENECSTYGHVFTNSEMRALATGAGLRVTGRLAIDYGSGKVQWCRFFGNLLYHLQKVSSA